MMKNKYQKMNKKMEKMYKKMIEKAMMQLKESNYRKAPAKHIL